MYAHGASGKQAHHQIDEAEDRDSANGQRERRNLAALHGIADVTGDRAEREVLPATFMTDIE